MNFLRFIVVFASASFVCAASIALAQTPSPAPGVLPRIIPDCDATLPPSDPRSCNVPKFFQLMNNVMEWLVIIVVPIAGVIIMYGGILIMTAGGTPGNIERGKSAIRSAVIGLVIAFGAWIIMRAILDALGVDSAILRGLGF